MQELLGGWQVTAINSASSGLPVNITYSPNSFQQTSPLLVQRPNLVGNPVIPKSKRIKLPGNQNLAALGESSLAVLRPLPDSLSRFASIDSNKCLPSPSGRFR